MLKSVHALLLKACTLFVGSSASGIVVMNIRQHIFVNKNEHLTLQYHSFLGPFLVMQT